MHFTVPYVTEVSGNDGKKIQMYKIYINGAHHCSARYNKFYELNEEMKQLFDNQELPYFPPKRVFKLSGWQIEFRRSELEYYIQRIASSSKLNNDVFHEFLKKCQRETKSLEPESVRLPIYFLDGTKFEIDVNSTDNTKCILEEFASLINLTRKMVKLFGLYLIRYSEDKSEMAVIRQIQDFEYPYLSWKELSQTYNCQIVLRKKIWDVDAESDLLSFSASNSTSELAALEVVFAQVLGEVKYGWLKCEEDDPRATRLNSLIQNRSKKETIQLARSLPYYGHMRIQGVCTTNRPVKNFKVFITIGGNEIHLLPIDQDPEQEICYSLTRIKSWRISTGEIDDIAANQNEEGATQKKTADGDHSKSRGPSMEGGLMSFEYLMRETKKLETIDIKNDSADQIILMSMSLKNMAEEYIKAKSENSANEYESYKYESLRQKPFTRTPSEWNSAMGSDTAKLVISQQKSMFYCSNIGDDDL